MYIKHKEYHRDITYNIKKMAIHAYDDLIFHMLLCKS